MTKLEELKAAARAAGDACDAAEAACDACDAAGDTCDACDALDAACVSAWDAYYDELEKTPREPVEDEGNPLV
jgi:hypothetical protein